MDGERLTARQNAAQRKSATLVSTLALGGVAKRRGLLQQFRLLPVAERSVVAQHAIRGVSKQLAHALCGCAAREPQRGAGLPKAMHAEWLDAYFASPPA